MIAAQQARLYFYMRTAMGEHTSGCKSTNYSIIKDKRSARHKQAFICNNNASQISELLHFVIISWHSQQKINK